MGPFITETWLREQFPLEHGTQLCLPANARLTPAARGLLDERRIAVFFGDGPNKDDTLPKTPNTGEKTAHDHVNPLTGTAERVPSQCQMCHQVVDKKPDTLTHLNATTLVAKNDPRLKLRGKLDTAIAQAVLVQTEFDPQNRTPILAAWLADIRSALGNALRAEVTGETMPDIHLGELDSNAIHALSHNPLRYLGQDHLVPEAAHGIRAAKLNLLRATIREAEISAAQVYIAHDFSVQRPDIMQGLNRLSSAVYVLTLMVYLADKGTPVPPERIRA